MITSGSRDANLRVPSPEDAALLCSCVIEAVSGGIIMQNCRGTVLAANRSASELLGVRSEDLIGQDLADVNLQMVRADGTPLMLDDWPGALAADPGKTSLDLTVGIHHSAGIRWVSVNANLLEADPGAHSTEPVVVCTLTDVTEQLRIERLKSEFVSVVSHELRTPITCIRGALSLMAAQLPEGSSTKFGRLLEMANTNADRLTRLIDDILDIERIDSGRTSLSLRQADSGELVKQVVDAIQPMAEQANVGLEVGSIETSWLWVDPDRIIQALTNLVSNAIKFSPPGSRVTLAVHHGDAETCFTVTDQGRGIPDDLLDSIFERFQQVDASDAREKGGTGLGLAICRSIANQHGGEVSVRSEVGEGSTFTLTLPALTGKEAPDGAGLGPAVLLGRLDSDQDPDETLATLFARAGCQIEHASIVNHTLQISTDLIPDAVVVDLGSTERMDPDHLCRLTADPTISRASIVMIVGRHAGDSGTEFSMRGRRIQPEVLVKRIVDLLAQTAEDQR